MAVADGSDGKVGHFAHEQEYLDYVIKLFDNEDSIEYPKNTALNIPKVPFVKAGTPLILDEGGESKILQYNIYRLPNSDGTYRYVADVKKLLGKGATASVYKWIDVMTGEPLAAKIIKDAETIESVTKEAERFNKVYAKLHDGKYRDSGKIFFTVNPKRDDKEGTNLNDTVAFIMPMFKGSTLDNIDQWNANIEESKSTFSLFQEPIKADAVVINDAPLVIEDDDDNRSLFIDGDDDDGLFIVGNDSRDIPDEETDNKTKLDKWGFGDKTEEQEFAIRQEEVAARFAMGEVYFPDGAHRVDIAEHINTFKEKKFNKEQIKDELYNAVKENLKRFVMREAETLPDMTPDKNFGIDNATRSPDFGKRLLPISELNVKNFDFLLLVFKNMLQSVSVAHEAGFFINDLKLENFLFDKSGNVYLIDLGEAVDKDHRDPKMENEFILRGTVTYATPQNLLSLMNNRLHYPEAEKARKLLALMALYKENELDMPPELAALDQEKLEETAKAWKYTYDADNDAYALGCCAELMCALLIPDTAPAYKTVAGFGLPGRFGFAEDDTKVVIMALAKINAFLRITKGLRGQDGPQWSINQAIDSVEALRIEILNTVPVGPAKPITANSKEVTQPLKIKNNADFITSFRKLLKENPATVDLLRAESFTVASEGVLPDKCTSDTYPVQAALFSQWLKIVRNPSENTHKDMLLLRQRLTALEDVQKQLKNPTASQKSITGRLANKIQPYVKIGAIMKTSTNMERQSIGWDNVIQMLAVDLDPQKYKLEVKADKSVIIKDVNTKKTAGSLALEQGNVYGSTTEEAAFEQMLNVYIASHKQGEQVQITIVGLGGSDADVETAFKFEAIAKKLNVAYNFDQETKYAIQKYRAPTKPSVKI